MKFASSNLIESKTVDSSGLTKMILLQLLLC